MRFYETLYIVHPALESGRLKDIILELESHVKTLDGKILATDIWGKKKLAYLINKQKYGTYILVQFNADGSKVFSLNQELEHNPNILSYITTRIEKDDVIKDPVVIEEQLRESSMHQGQTKKTEEKDFSKEAPAKDSPVEEAPAEEAPAEEAPAEEAPAEEAPAEEAQAEEAPAEEAPAEESQAEEAPAEESSSEEDKNVDKNEKED